MHYEGMIYRPPSEAYSLILQVTAGCSHNQCTFCTMYKDKQFHIKPLSVIEVDLKEASHFYGHSVDRIFLADGDALVLSTDKLTHILNLCHQYFPNLQRITSYATARDILRKSQTELSLLHSQGLSMVYMGVESGSDRILQQVQKGTDTSTMIQAAQHLKPAGIKNSVTLISGLGGQQLLEEHALESARVISQMNPEYLGFLTLMTDPAAPIMDAIHSGMLNLLTPSQVVTEMELFLSNIDSEGTVFRSNHASNYISLRGTLNRDIPAMLETLSKAKETQAYKQESMRAL